jgi:Fe-S cluster assembly iron-binding protein IscA
VQASYFSWAKLHPEARRAYAIPNAAKRSVRLAAMMKAEGLRKGVLDVHLPIPRGGCAGLWIEFKCGNNDLTPEQKAEAEQLAKDGFAVYACWGSIVAIELTCQYLDGKLQPGFTSLKPVPPKRVRATSKQ